MRRFVVSVVVLACVAVIALGGAAFAVTVPAPPYETNVECLECHDVALGGAALSKVDFSAPSVDYAACKSCHCQPVNHYNTIASSGQYCIDCHAAGSYFAFEPEPPANAPYFGSDTTTTYGVFDGAASISTSAADLHRIHVNGNWVTSTISWDPSCKSCHGPAACSSCHGANVSHGAHITDTVSYNQSFGPAVSATWVNSASTCVTGSCHVRSASGLNAQPACSTCHTAKTDIHGYGSIDHVAADGVLDGIACSACHSLDLSTAHGDPAAAGGSCATCHPTPRDSVGGWDQSCATGSCHTETSSAPMHANVTAAHTVASSNALCLECHAGTELGSIHAGATDPADGSTSCLVCHKAGVLPSTGDCTSCHFTFEQHYGAERHTSSWTLVGCAGTGCHNTRDLFSVHTERNPAFTCDGCHKNFSVALQIQNHLTGCGDCHTGVTQSTGHRDAHWATPLLQDATGPHYSYSTGSAGTQPTGDCIGCHASNFIDEHMGSNDATTGFPIRLPRYSSDGSALTCDTCHGSADTAVIAAIASGAAACEACHPVHAPIAQTHTSSFVDSPALPCGDCHSADIAGEHESRTATTSSGVLLVGCDACHGYYEGERGAQIQSAIGVTNDTRCSACHAVYHAGLATSHSASSTASLACGSCHAVGQTAIDVTAVHADSALGACKVCHANTAVGQISDHTPECASCHPAEGTDYHTAMTSSHTFGAMESYCTASGCHPANTLPEVHQPYMSRYPQYADACALCHFNADPARIPAGATADCASCHTVHGDLATIHTTTLSAACAGCHGSADVRAIHGTSPEASCAVCHNASLDLAGKTTECASCHVTEKVDFHTSMDARHIGLGTSGTCEGAGCHPSRDVTAIHARYVGPGNQYSQYPDTCSLCHLNADATRIDWATTTDGTCANCHGVPHDRMKHSATSAASVECIGCHGSWLPGIHLADPAQGGSYANCDTCHNNPVKGDLAWDKTTSDCEGCHSKSPAATNHYAATSHTASESAECAACHSLELAPEHAKSTSGPVDCLGCHTSSLFAAATKPWSRTCDACHAAKHADMATKHASTRTDCAGSGCHLVTDVSAIHPACTACHSAISMPGSTDCATAGCHPALTGGHHELHNSTAVNPNGCSGCHFMYLDDEHLALGYTCDTCHKSASATVQAAIAANDLRCRTCHPDSPHNRRQEWEFNPTSASVHRVSADLPGMRASFAVNGSAYTWSLPTAASFLKSGWTTTSMMTCADCHSYSGASGPHGASMKVNIDPAYPSPFRATGTASTAQLSPNSPTGMSMTKSGSSPAGIICEKCHDLNGTGSSFSNVVHKEHDDRGSEGAYCNYCHVGVPHGWSRPRLIGYTTDAAPYATAKGGVQRISVKNYTPSGWQKSDCGAGCSSGRHPLTGSSWPGTGGGGTTPAPTAGAVSGRVTNAMTSAAVSGATVSIGGKSATSASDGAYTVSDLGAGTYTMTVTATGYDAWSASVSVTEGSTLTKDVALTATSVAPAATNLARSGIASASSYDSDYTRASRAIDGDSSTYWRPHGNGTEWLRVDLGAAKTFDRVVVNWTSSYYARTYRVETSNDGSNWSSRFSTSSGNGGSDTITFVPVNARYVRLYCTSAYGYSYRVSEFEVWGY